ncbi:flavin-dependent oxidoreductase [Roseomonas alkaliterrae]|uniref:2-polyprenyl-6-methoxyphenol hydroxylase-like FAD-dependent oxidoreductase n=1 Tax=Neoroseomonas alkaliterrae TaxID=1452450 RepID=A0A840XRK1_9PROT|nr:flavin-dependent oxidoreductase [Neoroseomonas alkaliterrae]MBB5689550.1 2-polyprenyl-6-methoxyphenol hydroxylase-like FAD-dependent oxidoreductase [Neoroseomonas alkaliterrae]MBR0678363.1 flavin-dependent oxidoreductase [Neoroseomonas alkaliterrae]
MRVIIAGGGIGGLVLALSLHEAGIACEVHEQVAEIRPLGVGINVLPHAMRELTELGLLERVLAAGVATRELVYANRFGQMIWSEPRGLAAGYAWPQVSIHRGRLHMLLLEAARERLGDGCIHLGARLSGFEQDASGVTARFEDGGRARGDVLVAADGIHSTVRGLFHPGEGPPIWNGAVLWRATSIAEPFLTGATMAQIGTRDVKFVVYPIASLPDGRMLTNWIAERRLDPSQPWKREDWNRPGRIEDFLPAFADWRFPWLDVPGLIRTAEAVFEFPMVDRDPLPRWTHGRVTLLGDAAHPLYPIGSNGASQGILDARTLAFKLATIADPAAALDAYEAIRRPATAALLEATRGDGPDVVLDIAAARAPEGFEDIEAVMPLAEREEIAMRYKRLAGFEPATLNARPSLSPPRRAA